MNADNIALAENQEENRQRETTQSVVLQSSYGTDDRQACAPWGAGCQGRGTTKSHRDLKPTRRLD